jgi:glycosyltransferase involved in cell wall biosynthesis
VTCCGRTFRADELALKRQDVDPREMGVKNTLSLAPAITGTAIKRRIWHENKNTWRKRRWVAVVFVTHRDTGGWLTVKPVVSVIVPVHNRLRLLRRALDTVLAQEDLGRTFDLETLVVDDASDRVTENDVRRVIGDSPVGYIRRITNGGLPVARNTAIAATSGEFVAFLDDDDEFLPHKLRVQVPILMNQPDVAMVYGSCIARASDGTEYLLRGGPSGWIFRDMLLKGSIMQVGTVLVRRSALERHSGFDETMKAIEDYDLWLRIAHDSKIAYVDQPVSVYDNSPGKYVRDLEDGTALQHYWKLIAKIALYSPQEAGLARAQLLTVWLGHVRDILPTDKVSLAFRNASLSMSKLSPQDRLFMDRLSFFLRDSAVRNKVSGLRYAHDIIESLPRSVRGVLWGDLSLSLLKRLKIGASMHAIVRGMITDPQQTIHAVARSIRQ